RGADDQCDSLIGTHRPGGRRQDLRPAAGTRDSDQDRRGGHGRGHRRHRGRGATPGAQASGAPVAFTMSQGENMRLLSALLIAPVWLAAQTAPSAPADTTDKKAAPPPPPPPAATVNPPQPPPAGSQLARFAEASYASSGRRLDDTPLAGRVFRPPSNRL